MKWEPQFSRILMSVLLLSDFTFINNRCNIRYWSENKRTIKVMGILIELLKLNSLIENKCSNKGLATLYLLRGSATLEFFSQYLITCRPPIAYRERNLVTIITLLVYNVSNVLSVSCKHQYCTSSTNNILLPLLLPLQHNEPPPLSLFSLVGVGHVTLISAFYWSVLSYFQQFLSNVLLLLTQLFVDILNFQQIYYHKVLTFAFKNSYI